MDHYQAMWKPLNIEEMTRLSNLAGYKFSPTLVKYTCDEDYIVERTIILVFKDKPQFSPRWINMQFLIPYRDFWIAYGRCFSRKDKDGLWIYECQEKDMFSFCVTSEDSDEDVLQYYMNSKCRHRVTYGPIDMVGITWLHEK